MKKIISIFFILMIVYISNCFASNVEDDINFSVSNQPVIVSELSIKDNPFVGNARKDFDIKFKNLSNKDIDAIEFTILFFDTFNNPAMINNTNQNYYTINNSAVINNTNQNYYTMIFQQKIKINKIKNSSWYMYNCPNAMKGKILIKQVHFTDDTIWVNDNYDDLLITGKDSFK